MKTGLSFIKKNQMETTHQNQDWYLKLSEQGQYLHEKLFNYYLYSKAKAKSQKRKNLWIKISIACLSAISTIILGIQLDWIPNYLIVSRNIAFILNVLLVFIGLISLFLDIEYRWKRNSYIQLHLKLLQNKFLYEAKKPNGISDQTLQEIFDAYQEITKQNMEYWKKQEAEKILQQATKINAHIKN